MDLFLSMLTLGLVTSLHCVSMCGPMVVTYAVKGVETGRFARRLMPNLAYQTAKIASYVLVGLLLGAVGSLLDLGAVRPYVMVAAGVFMIVLAVGMTGRVPWAARLAPRPPRFLVSALAATRRRAAASATAQRTSLATPITFGLLTGLMPCAPLMAAQLNAAASGSASSGALAMLAFGLGTAPLMLAFGTASSLIPRRFKERVMTVLAVVVLVFGATYLNRGAMLLGSPVTLQSMTRSVLGGGAAEQSAGYRTGSDGVVEVPLVIANTQFVPATIDVPADVPVRLVVERRESNPCSDQLAVPQLGVLADLAPNATTVVDLPPARKGSYTLTCGMGMMSGTVRAGAAAGDAARDGAMPAVLLAAVSALGVAAVLRRTAPPSEGKRRLLGLTPKEMVLATAGTIVAVLAGLAAGGLL